jgi:hypothetical protein
MIHANLLSANAACGLRAAAFVRVIMTHTIKG